MPNYTEKMTMIVEITAIMRNIWAKQVELGKISHEEADKNYSTLKAIHGDYGRKKLVTLAGILAEDTWFRTYVGFVSKIPRKVEPKEAASYIREYCGIVSRRDLASNKEARVKFEQLRENFNDWRKYRQNAETVRTQQKESWP